MIKEVHNKKDLKQFIYFINDLYKDDDLYVFPIFYALRKELNQEVLETKKYKALLSIRENRVVGRVLYTIDYSKKQDKKICYYSFLDAIDDFEVFKEIFDYMSNDMKDHGIDYMEGTFSPYDPDTRRGVLVSGFDIAPTLFTSYNYDYYQRHIENYGFTKAIDTVSLNAKVNEKSKKRLNTLSKFFKRSHDVRIDSLNFKNLEKDLNDVHMILESATNEIVYQDAPSVDLVAHAAKSLKPFIKPEFIKIARENGTDKPVGFCLVLPDFNQVLKRTKGKIRPIRMMLLKRKINKARGTMQYIIPEYQNTGLIGHMFNAIFDEFVKFGVVDFEAGTMMENNDKPINAFKKFGGEIIKVYRLYGKEIGK